MRKSSGFWKVAVAFAFYGGLEFRNVVALKWDSFAKPGLVVITDAEERSRIEVPLTPEMKETIDSVPRHDHEEYLFPEEKRMHDKASTRSNLSVYFGRICQSMGIAQGRFSDLRRLYYQSQVRTSRPSSLAKDLYDFSSISSCETLTHS